MCVYPMIFKAIHSHDICGFFFGISLRFSRIFALFIYGAGQTKSLGVFTMNFEIKKYNLKLYIFFRIWGLFDAVFVTSPLQKKQQQFGHNL